MRGFFASLRMTWVARASLLDVCEGFHAVTLSATKGLQLFEHTAELQIPRPSADGLGMTATRRVA